MPWVQNQENSREFWRNSSKSNKVIFLKTCCISAWQFLSITELSEKIIYHLPKKRHWNHKCFHLFREIKSKMKVKIWKPQEQKVKLKNIPKNSRETRFSLVTPGVPFFVQYLHHLKKKKVFEKIPYYILKDFSYFSQATKSVNPRLDVRLTFANYHSHCP